MLTSAVKRLDVAVFTTIEEFDRGRLQTGGTSAFSLRNGGLGLGAFSAVVPEPVRGELAAVEAAIAAGSIASPDEFLAHSCLLDGDPSGPVADGDVGGGLAQREDVGDGTARQVDPENRPCAGVRRPQRPVPGDNVRAAPEPMRMVWATAAVSGSIHQTEPRASATQTAPSPAAIATGWRTGTSAVIARVRGSTRSARSAVVATHTAPSATATATGTRPTSIGAAGSLVAGSMRTRSWGPVATQAACPSTATAYVVFQTRSLEPRRSIVAMTASGRIDARDGAVPFADDPDEAAPASRGLGRAGV